MALLTLLNETKDTKQLNKIAKEISGTAKMSILTESNSYTLKLFSPKKDSFGILLYDGKNALKEAVLVKKSGPKYIIEYQGKKDHALDTMHSLGKTSIDYRLMEILNDQINNYKPKNRNPVRMFHQVLSKKSSKELINNLLGIFEDKTSLNYKTSF